MRQVSKDRCAKHSGNIQVMYPAQFWGGIGYHNRLSEEGEERSVNHSQDAWDPGWWCRGKDISGKGKEARKSLQRARSCTRECKDVQCCWVLGMVTGLKDTEVLGCGRSFSLGTAVWI